VFAWALAELLPRGPALDGSGAKVWRRSASIHTAHHGNEVASGYLDHARLLLPYCPRNLPNPILAAAPPLKRFWLFLSSGLAFRA
jgi:hypothetical protein